MENTDSLWQDGTMSQPDGLTFEAIHDLVKRVEREGYTDRYGVRRKLVPSTPRGSLWALARRIYARREQFAPGVVISDLEVAISNPDFDGLHGKAWGLLLSHAFIGRFIAAVNRRAVRQQAVEDAARRRLEFGFTHLDAGDPTERCRAAYYLLQSRPDLAVPVLIELLRVTSPEVKAQAASVLAEWGRDVVNRPIDRVSTVDRELVAAVLVAAKAVLNDAVNPPARNSYCWSDLTSLVIGLGSSGA
jgi:hypothetical protein